MPHSRLAPPPALMLLTPALQRYAWGDKRAIPELLGLPVTESPCAEAWFGAHPKAPATARHNGQDVALDALLEAQAEPILGPALAAQGGGLPYLLKLLAAARPLSIQVHPNRAQAKAGFAREEAAGIARDAPERCYRDTQPKPELLIALSSFAALCGFRPLDEIAQMLHHMPELSDRLPAFDKTAAGLRRWLAAYFAQPQAEVETAWTAALTRLAAELGRLPAPVAAAATLAQQVHANTATQGRPDRGLLFVLLLRHVVLQPGQALFLPAGVPHAYLEGFGVEVMAASDNVLRAGLTAKHIDPAGLLQVLRTDSGAPPVLEAVADERGVEWRMPVPVPDFDVRRLQLTECTPFTAQAHGPETLLLLDAAPGTTVTLQAEGTRMALRRGHACLVPHGQRYRITAEAPVQLIRVRPAGGERAGDFRGHTPRALRFGTSGLRGLVEDITDLEAYVNTRGFLDHMVACGEATASGKVALAGDLRPSTDSTGRSILRAVARAVTDAGFQVLYAGRIPTPALLHYGLQEGCVSIMVTGSHIPFDRNGIKFHKASGEVLKSDEAAILAAVERVRVREYSRSAADSLFQDDGFFRPDQVQPLPAVDDVPGQRYRERYTELFGPEALRGLRVAVYEHSAVGRDMLVKILSELGATVYVTGRSEHFIAIDTEAMDSTQLAQLQVYADMVQGACGRIDAMVSTDGDSDRPMLLGLQEDGRLAFIAGDVLGALVADSLQADSIAVPISTSDLIDRHFVPRGIPVVRTRIGSPWVVAAMAQLPGQRRVGWEANGGFLTASPLPVQGKILPPLPTRDALLPLIAVLVAARQQDKSVLALRAALPARFSQSGLLDQVPPEDSRAIRRHFGPPDAAMQAVRRHADSFVWTDNDGAEHAADHAQQAQLVARFAALEAHFDASRGFGRLEAIDDLDGMRLSFAGGDIAHVRPSGNAPQLRLYAVADRPERAQAIIQQALAEPDGILQALRQSACEARFVRAIQRNIAHTAALFADGQPPAHVGVVCGSAPARDFWHKRLEAARTAFRATAVHAFHEDLPVNQAFGLLLLWQRLRPALEPGEGALIAFVFGEGSRATPFTEAECGQKPALRSFVPLTPGGQQSCATSPAQGRCDYASIVELALRYFAPVEAHLRRSGFAGLVVKWGDEVQIPSCDLSGANPRYAGADIVRFVSMQAMTEQSAASKDWVGVAADGQVTAFIPRRPLAEMAALAERGLVQQRGDTLIGGVNLGSIAISHALLDALLAAFHTEVTNAHAHRKDRPDLDPQFFTALTIAALDVPSARAEAWIEAQQNPAIAQLARLMPDIVPRLRQVLDDFERQHGRRVRLVAMDFQGQYWGDVGQHRQMHAFYSALTEPGAAGQISRCLAGVPEAPSDANANRVIGDSHIGPHAVVRRSVLIDAQVHGGLVEDSVLIGTRAGHLEAHSAFDVQSTVTDLRLAPRAGSYKVIADAPVQAAPGERLTTVFLPDGEPLLRVHEDCDLRDKAAHYDAPTGTNPLAFADVHRRVVAADPAALGDQRETRQRAVAAQLPHATK